MENRLAWSTNPIRYTIIHRRKGNRRAYRYGCYSYSLAEMLEIGQLEAESGNYTINYPRLKSRACESEPGVD